MTWQHLIEILGGWTLLVSGAGIFINKLLTERLMARWKRVEDERLEAVKAHLGHDRVLLETAIKGQQLGQDATQQNRLRACENLWKVTVRLRKGLGLSTLFFEVLLPSEYDNAVRGGKFGVAAITDTWVMQQMAIAEELEFERPYMGELLWALFFIYRGVLGRLTVLIQKGMRGENMKDWRVDTGITQLLTALPSKKLDSYLSNKHPIALRSTLNLIESAMLEEMGQIISGKRSATESMMQAKEAREALLISLRVSI